MKKKLIITIILIIMSLAIWTGLGFLAFVKTGLYAL